MADEVRNALGDDSAIYLECSYKTGDSTQAKNCYFDSCAAAAGRSSFTSCSLGNVHGGSAEYCSGQVTSSDVGADKSGASAFFRRSDPLQATSSTRGTS